MDRVERERVHWWDGSLFSTRLLVRSQDDILTVVSPSPCKAKLDMWKQEELELVSAPHYSSQRTEVAIFLQNRFQKLDHMVHPTETAEYEQLKSACSMFIVWLRYACSAQLLHSRKLVTKGSLVLGTACDVSALVSVHYYLWCLLPDEDIEHLSFLAQCFIYLLLEHLIHEYVFRSNSHPTTLRLFS